MYSPEIREPWQRKRQTAAISPTYGDDDQSGQDKSPCSTHLHHRKTNFTCVYFQNVRLLLTGAPNFRDKRAISNAFKEPGGSVPDMVRVGQSRAKFM